MPRDEIDAAWRQMVALAAMLFALFGIAIALMVWARLSGCLALPWELVPGMPRCPLF